MGQSGRGWSYDSPDVLWVLLPWPLQVQRAHHEWLLDGVNLPSKVAIDFEQFPNIFERYLFDKDDCDKLIKSSHVVEKDELYDVITSLEINFNLD